MYKRVSRRARKNHRAGWYQIRKDVKENHRSELKRKGNVICMGVDKECQGKSKVKEK